RYRMLLLQLKASLIRIRGERTDRLKVVDEQFLVQFGSTDDMRLYICDVKQDELKEGRFHLSEKNWRVISLYDGLILRTMTFHFNPFGGYLVRTDTLNYAYFKISAHEDNTFSMDASFYKNWKKEGENLKLR
ncbi:hypothetical protein PENTCL1PPCAC_2934, partial [Pristionchus entomophagus]